MICPTGKSPICLSSPSCKNILIFRNRDSVYIPAVPPQMRGVSRSSRTLVRDAMDAMCHETSDAVADGEIVWSWRPDAGVKFAQETARMTVAKEPIAGESTKEPVKPLRGECRVFSV